jgi:Ner family transcriptional regulator
MGDASVCAERQKNVFHELLAHLIVFMIITMYTQKGIQPTDWHPADVKAALEKRGVSLRQLAKSHGYSHFQRVLTTHWWAAEQIVAAALETKPEAIWPSRYERPRTNAKKRTSKITLTRSGRIRLMVEERT